MIARIKEHQLQDGTLGSAAKGEAMSAIRSWATENAHSRDVITFARAATILVHFYFAWMRSVLCRPLARRGIKTRRMATATSNGGSKAIESGRDFHLLTIGGGSGGVRASRFAARDGGTVGLVEMPFDRISSENTGGLGGTCVLRGCVPKKLMMYGSEFSAHFEDSVGFGWQPEFPPLDFQKLVARKDQEIKRLNGVYGRLLSNAGVTSLDGKGKVLDAHTVEVTSPDGDTNQYTADNILIATGGHAIKPDIPGAEYTVDSDEMLSLPEQPRKLIVIGSGYIALEFASIYKGLGTDVDLVYRAELPLRGFDHDMRQTLQTALDGRGIKQYSSNSPTAIEKRSDGRYIVKTDKGNELEADLVMMATGRKPNTDRPYLGLDNAGVELGKDGAVKVDQYSQTNVSSIWAVGDVTNRINLTPVALMEGAIGGTISFDDVNELVW